MKKNSVKKKQISTAKYLSFFITRAFLIAVLLVISFSCFILVCYLGDYFINSKSGKSTSPLFGAYVIVSKSMVPTINVGDAIVIKRIDNDNYRIGDIITFTSSSVNYNGLAVTHRVVNKEQYDNNESLYTTKGDNNLLVDAALVKTEDIHGKVLFKVPSVGFTQSFFKKPVNFLFCFLIPTMLFIIYELIKINSLLRQKED